MATHARAKTVKAGEFKAKCLELMDRVAETGEPITITKRGRPVARLVSVEPPPKSIFGFAKGTFEILGDIISPVTPPWSPDEAEVALLNGEPAPRRKSRRRTSRADR